MADPAQTPETGQEGKPETPVPGQEQGSHEATSETSQSQKELDELRAKLKRLEGNNNGNYQEYLREKAERERLQAMLTQYQTQPVQHPGRTATPQEPSDEDLAAAESDAILEGNKSKLAEIRRQQREKAKREALQELQSNLQAVSQQQDAQMAVREYMVKHGITSPADPNWKKVEDRMREMAADPAYRFAAGNQQLLAVLAAKDVDKEIAVSKARGEDTARKQRSEEAFTESDTGRGSGAPPGQKPPKADKMYFHDRERREIDRLASYMGITVEEASKRYWSRIPEDARNRRVTEGRAV